MYIGNRYSLIDQIQPHAALIFSQGGYVSQNHLAPSPENLEVMQHFNMKMVLHLRDPRQAMLSCVHHLERIARGSDTSIELFYFNPKVPPGYFSRAREQKIDWQIENYLPRLVAWTTRWLELVNSKALPALITQQEDLRTKEKAFFDDILAFYGLDLDYTLPGLPRTIEETHFRLADPAEWRRVFTREQIERSTAAIPCSLRKRFGWDQQAETQKAA